MTPFFLRVRSALVARGKRWRKLAWRPVTRAARRGFEASAIVAAGALLPPWRCPGCGGWRKRRRLAECGGVIDAPVHRSRVFATGCPRCGLLYVLPAPPASRLRDLYSAHGEWSAAHSAAARRSVGQGLVEAVDAVTRFRTPPPDARVLDFGCGHGRWLNAFARAGWKTFGIDPALKTAFDRHTELQQVGTEAAYQFIILSHVLEHVTNPGALLASLGRVTRPGGWIYVAVPSVDGLPRHGDWKYVLNANTHISAYSLDCLNVLLARAGFGAPVLISVGDYQKTRTRLRLVAQRGAAPQPIIRPLASALNALRRVDLS